MKLRLTDADRERYGGDEWLDWDPNRLTVSEAELLQEQVGVEVERYRGPDGWLRTGGVASTKWVLWLCLHRAGVDVEWTSFDPDVLGVRVLTSPEPEAPEGKAQGRSTRRRRSGSGDSSTPQP